MATSSEQSKLLLGLKEINNSAEKALWVAKEVRKYFLRDASDSGKAAVKRNAKGKRIVTIEKLDLTAEEAEIIIKTLSHVFSKLALLSSKIQAFKPESDVSAKEVHIAAIQLKLYLHDTAIQPFLTKIAKSTSRDLTELVKTAIKNGFDQKELVEFDQVVQKNIKHMEHVQQKKGQRGAVAIARAAALRQARPPSRRQAALSSAAQPHITSAAQYQVSAAAMPQAVPPPAQEESKQHDERMTSQSEIKGMRDIFVERLDTRSTELVSRLQLQIRELQNNIEERETKRQQSFEARMKAAEEREHARDAQIAKLIADLEVSKEQTTQALTQRDEMSKVISDFQRRADSFNTALERECTARRDEMREFRATIEQERTASEVRHKQEIEDYKNRISQQELLLKQQADAIAKLTRDMDDSRGRAERNSHAQEEALRQVDEAQRKTLDAQRIIVAQQADAIAKLRTEMEASKRITDGILTERKKEFDALRASIPDDLITFWRDSKLTLRALAESQPALARVAALEQVQPIEHRLQALAAQSDARLHAALLPLRAGLAAAQQRAEASTRPEDVTRIASEVVTEMTVTRIGRGFGNSY